MKQITFTILAILCSILYGWLTNLFFCFIAPYYMLMGWTLTIICLFVVGSFIKSILYLISAFLGAPMMYFSKGSKVAKLANVVIMLYYGYHSVTVPWNCIVEYNALQVILAIAFSSFALALYIDSIYASFASFKDDAE